uniref:Basic proline-rich protein-like n=1 Tax=Knipowitschia caucasica TaxID=637954 RepID=A0AAV2K8Q6_KNICA
MLALYLSLARPPAPATTGRRQRQPAQPTGPPSSDGAPPGPPRPGSPPRPRPQPPRARLPRASPPPVLERPPAPPSPRPRRPPGPHRGARSRYPLVPSALSSMQGASHPRAPSATLGGCRRSRHRPRHTYPGRAGRSTPDPHQALNQRRPAPVSPTHRTRGGTTRPVAPPGVGVGVTHPQAPAQNWRPSHTRPSRAGRHHLSHPPAKPAAPPVRAQRPRAPPSQPAPGGVWLGALSTPSGVTGRAQQGCAGPRRPGAPPFRPPPPRPERLSALRGVEGAPTAARSPTRGQQERIPAPRLRGPRHRPHPRGPGAWPTVNPPPPRGGTHNPRSHRGPQGGVAGGCSSHASPAVPTGRAAPRRAWAPPPPAPVPPVPAVPWPPHPPFPPFPLSPPVPLSPPPPLSSGRSLPVHSPGGPAAVVACPPPRLGHWASLGGGGGGGCHTRGPPVAPRPRRFRPQPAHPRGGQRPAPLHGPRRRVPVSTPHPPRRPPPAPRWQKT